MSVYENIFNSFSDGIYYIPRKTIFGVSRLDTNTIISKKYLGNDKEIYGYVAGMTLLNAVGLTTQVSNRITIVSNKESIFDYWQATSVCYEFKNRGDKTKLCSIAIIRNNSTY